MKYNDLTNHCSQQYAHSDQVLDWKEYHQKRCNQYKKFTRECAANSSKSSLPVINDPKKYKFII